MARPALTPEQRAEREAERAELYRDVKKRNTSTLKTEDKMEPNENKETNQQTTNPVTETPASTTETVKPAETVETPAQTTNSSTENIAEKTHTIADVKNYQPDKDYSMLGGNRKVRSYSTPVINQELMNKEIPEPVIGVTQVTEQSAEALLNPKPANETPSQILPRVEGFDKLTTDEQKQAAAQTADLVLGAYDTLHRLGRKILVVNEEELEEMHREDKMDIHEPAFEDDDDPNGEGLSIKQYFLEYNKEIEKDFVVTQQFKDAVRPPLERICVKNGWGASDGLFLAVKFGEDILFKAGMVYGFKKHVNKMMDGFMSDHERTKKKIEDGVKRQLEKQAKEKAAIDAQIAKQNGTEVKETPVATTTAVDSVEVTETKKD